MENQNLMKLAIGKAIEFFRLEMKLNQTQLSILVYKKDAQLTVSKSETAKRNIPTHELLEYLKAFHIPPEKFFNQVNKEYAHLKNNPK